MNIGDALFVRWGDAVAGKQHWMSLDEVPTEPREIRTAGILIHETDKALTLALNVDTADPKAYGETICIPKAWLLEDPFVVLNHAI